MRIIVRGDSGFCRENLMRWCEENRVDYVLGLAKNARLQRILGQELHEAKLQFEATGQASRVFKDFTYQTRKSWSRERRVVGKAEHLAKGSNPRFVVTSLSAEEVDARTLYEDVYCARGEMENRIKEQQMCLFADRTSCATMRANQLRLWLSSVAYTLADGVAAVRSARHGDGAGALRHDPVEAVEDWGRWCGRRFVGCGFRCRRVVRINGCLPRCTRTCGGGRCRCRLRERLFRFRNLMFSAADSLKVCADRQRKRPNRLSPPLAAIARHRPPTFSPRSTPQIIASISPPRHLRLRCGPVRNAG